MKHVRWFKHARFVLLALLVVAFVAWPAAAQEPGKQGDVEAAQSLHAGFCLNPNSNGIATPGCPAGPAQTVPSGGTATTEVTTGAVDNLASVTIAFDYNKDVVQVRDIRAGSLFEGLTEGVDYRVDKTKIGGYAAPFEATEPPIPGAGGCGIGSITCWRSYVSIAIFNLANPQIPSHGNGSLVKIYWQVQASPAITDSTVTFPILSMADSSGSSLWPCLPSDPTATTETVFCKPLPVTPLAGNNVAPTAHLAVGAPSSAGLMFQVSLEGGKVPGNGNPAITWPPNTTATAGVFVAVADALGNIAVPFAAAYPSVSVSRPGYLSARAANVLPGQDLGLVTLKAGDVTGDNVVNIFDLTVVAGSLGSPVGNNPSVELMDFNGDQVITIADLALVAKNYGLSGPTTILAVP